MKVLQFQRFKARNDISLRNLHGESASANDDVASTSRMSLQAVLSKYYPCDVYNIDETGLFFRMPPSESLTSGPRHGTKQFKDRITVALCTNVDVSDRMKPWVIGKRMKPQ